MASPIGPKGSISIDTDGMGSSIPIQISESAGVKAQNLSLSTWGASFVLANQLHKIKVPSLSCGTRNGTQHTDFSVLELGAGTGLVGLAAATIWNAHVMLTDLPSIVPSLAANIALNESLLAEHKASASFGSLDWTNPIAIDQVCSANSNRKLIRPHPSSKPSVILAADTIYDADHPGLVSNTIVKWLAPGLESRAILCYPLRMAYIEQIRDFWGLMQAGGLECVEEGREEGNDDWNEVANTPYEWCVWQWKTS